MPNKIRHLVIVLGDQLDLESGALDDFDVARDRVWMAEVPQEATHVWSHKARIALFLSAMRHHRKALERQGRVVEYHHLGGHSYLGLQDALRDSIRSLQPEQLVIVHPGDHRVLDAIRSLAQETGVALDVRPDRHFLIDMPEFEDWARKRKLLRLEDFYRFMRSRTGILMEDGRPRGGVWNFDRENRKTFGKRGPGAIPAPRSFATDDRTLEVLLEVERRYPDHPGSLANFDWPVTREQAEQALADFIEHRLPAFGPYQDAMWTDEPFLYHSRLASSLNLKLLSARRVIDAALEALDEGHAPLASVEGFIRQVLGWREFVRGLYWMQMPEYLKRNALAADRPLPAFYWTGETDMQCLRQTITQTLEFGYAHHIQRLMVTGLFALLLGVRPHNVHEWYLAVYIDAVEWVELPNTLGMSQYADGGLIASKPYVASGKYIQRMSNYCSQCPYNPAHATEGDACPFTTLYWDFLLRHHKRFADHPRAALQWRSLERIDTNKRRAIRRKAEALKQALAPSETETPRSTHHG